MRALFIALPDDQFALRVVSNIWRGDGRDPEVRTSDQLPFDFAGSGVDVLVVVATGLTLTDRGVTSTIEGAREVSIPVLGIDGSHIVRAGESPRPGAEPCSDYQRLYLWTLDDGKWDIGQWIKKAVDPDYKYVL